MASNVPTLNSNPPRQFSRDKRLLQKKNLLKEMHFVQIVELELRGPGPLVVYLLLIRTGYLYYKTKISVADLRVNYLMLKVLQRAMYLASPDVPFLTTL